VLSYCPSDQVADNEEYSRKNGYPDDDHNAVTKDEEREVFKTVLDVIDRSGETVAESFPECSGLGLNIGVLEYLVDVKVYGTVSHLIVYPVQSSLQVFDLITNILKLLLEHDDIFKFCGLLEDLKQSFFSDMHRVETGFSIVIVAAYIVNIGMVICYAAQKGYFVIKIVELFSRKTYYIVGIACNVVIGLDRTFAVGGLGLYVAAELFYERLYCGDGFRPDL